MKKKICIFNSKTKERAHVWTENLGVEQIDGCTIRSTFVQNKVASPRVSNVDYTPHRSNLAYFANIKDIFGVERVWSLRESCVSQKYVRHSE